jgi:hypothetical protein
MTDSACVLEFLGCDEEARIANCESPVSRMPVFALMVRQGLEI